MRWSALPVLVVLSSAACVKRVDAPVSNEIRPVRLLVNTPERETTQIQERREDVEIDTTDFERTPRLVASGETPVISLEGRAARLYGDAAGTEGFTVDNLILLEVIGEDGKVLERVSVGFTDGVIIGKEHVDNLGRRSFNFEPGEINLTPKLPERRAFKLRASVLDYNGVGKVSDVFVVLKPEGLDHSGDELRGQ